MNNIYFVVFQLRLLSVECSADVIDDEILERRGARVIMHLTCASEHVNSLSRDYVTRYTTCIALLSMATFPHLSRGLLKRVHRQFTP